MLSLVECHCFRWVQFSYFYKLKVISSICVPIIFEHVQFPLIYFNFLMLNGCIVCIFQKKCQSSEEERQINASLICLFTKSSFLKYLPQISDKEHTKKSSLIACQFPCIYLEPKLIFLQIIPEHISNFQWIFLMGWESIAFKLKPCVQQRFIIMGQSLCETHPMDTMDAAGPCSVHGGCASSAVTKGGGGGWCWGGRMGRRRLCRFAI